MEVSLSGWGELVDELFVTNGDLEVRRVGTARYLARLREGDASIDLELWTTEKGRVRADSWPDRPAWVEVRTTDDSTLDSIDASGIDVHVEQMDRGVYFFGLSRGDDRWGLSLVSDGYIKTRVCGGRSLRRRERAERLVVRTTR